MSIQPGDLIKTTRASVGIPEGTVGLVIGQHCVGKRGLVVYVLKLHGIGSTLRFLGGDLEVVNASR